MLMRLRTALAFGSLVVASPLLRADEIYGLFNTGTTYTGSATKVRCIGTGVLDIAGCTNSLANGATDTHYSVTGGSPAATAAVAAPPVSFGSGAGKSWLSENTSSRWIRPNNTDTSNNNPAGPYTFKHTFTLGLGFTPSSGGIIGQWASDNGATLRVKLNNISIIPKTAPGGATSYNRWTQFEILDLSLFNFNGTNTLEFIVQNDAGTPSGLRVEYITAALPEPVETASLASMLLGALFLARRRFAARSQA